MSTYHERIIKEKEELDDKLAKLTAFIGTDIFKGLPLVSQDLMERQKVVMKEYSDILQTRSFIK